MDLQAFAEIMTSSGTPALFVVALVYLYKTQEKKEIKLAQEQKEREARDAARIASTEHFIRASLQAIIIDNTAALQEMSTTLKDLPCRECIHQRN